MASYYFAKNSEHIASYIKEAEKQKPDALPEWINDCTNSTFVYMPLLMEYFGIEERFLYDGKIYNLPKLITDKCIFDGCMIPSSLKILYEVYQKYSDDMAIEDILLELIAVLSDGIQNLIMFSPQTVEHFVQKKNLDMDMNDISLYDTDNPSIEDFLKALNSNIWAKVLRYWDL